jgi:hypothetical protein
MNAAYWLAIVWALLALFALLFVTGKNGALVCILTIASAAASLLGIALTYHLI